MKVRLFVIAFLFSWSAVSSQVNHSKISRGDSISLSNFWIVFKKAVIDKDIDGIKKLCEFPFNCSACLNSTDSNKNYVLVGKGDFDKGRYNVFFEKGLLKTISKYTMPKDLFIFNPALNDQNKKIGYEFSYIIHDETTNRAGLQGWVTLKKIAGNFKIISVWTMP